TARSRPPRRASARRCASGCKPMRPPPPASRTDGARMLFMVIERFRDHDMVPVYERVRNGGRMLPEGLRYIDSWVEPNFAPCFQLMGGDDPKVAEPLEPQW